VIREAYESDLEAIALIEGSCFNVPWQLKDLTYEFKENPYARLYVYEVEGEIVAYFDLWIIFERAEIARIAVKSGHRLNGYGKQMVKYILSLAAKEGCEYLFLEVRPSNFAAISLYKEMGFSYLRTKKDYYQDTHEDCLEMICIVKGETDEEDFSTGN